jgi:histidine triad (HIT) family protein
VTCVFCQIFAGESPAEAVWAWDGGAGVAEAVAIVPLDPVVDGHIIVIPAVHVEDWTTDPVISAMTMRHAAELAQHLGLGPCNLITSRGREATQSVFHLHLHIVPRAQNDGLALPWYSGRRKS